MAAEPPLHLPRSVRLSKPKFLKDQFDTIDLSDNEIVKLENFPSLNRLGTLFLNNNIITRINPNLGEFLPKLHTLVLTNNRLTNLVEIDPLASLPKLQFLSLLDNNITKKPNYQLYVIHKLKSLRVLDFRKVKQKLGSNGSNLIEEEHESHTISAWKEAKSYLNSQIGGQGGSSQLVQVFAGSLNIPQAHCQYFSFQSMQFRWGRGFRKLGRPIDSHWQC
ncbi:U2 small nuclear ribonucleoprotein A [Striga hermonthica]|uniref:U2 small nuclear ribonucleoprotein A n=1 Tax=Striga hermonthica TaxID=68872 RepID=A0A9N7N9D0_STRHE|nr:U2 small nuclear ribonucleoprotein A [Striga hermonthica]